MNDEGTFISLKCVDHLSLETLHTEIGFVRHRTNCIIHMQEGVHNDEASSHPPPKVEEPTEEPIIYFQLCFCTCLHPFGHVILSPSCQGDCILC